MTHPGRSLAFRLASPVPTFHDCAVLVMFHESIARNDEQLVMAAVTGLVRLLVNTGGRLDELPSQLAAKVAEHGLAARFIVRTREAIEFAVTKP